MSMAGRTGKKKADKSAVKRAGRKSDVLSGELEADRSRAGNNKREDREESSRKLRSVGDKTFVHSTDNAEHLKKQDSDKHVLEQLVHQVELEMQNEELRRTQEELAASQERYFELYDIAPVGYFSISEKGIILEANLTGANLFGAVPCDMCAQPFTRYISKEDQDVYYLHRQQLLKTLLPQVCEMRMVRRDGSLFWGRIEATVAQNAKSGKPVCLATMSDITERKLVEDALRESEQKYRSLIAQSPDGIFIVNLKGNFLSVNRAMYETLKYSEEELLSKSIWDIVPEQYMDLHKKRITDILVGKAPDTAAEYMVKGKDGNPYYVEILSAPYYEGKEIIGFHGIARNITESKKAERRIKESEILYRSLIETSPDAIGLMDLNGTITMYNKQALELFGFELTEDLMGKNIMDMVAPENYKEVLDKLEKLQKAEVIRNWELTSYKKDGAPFYLELSSSMLFDEEGKPKSIMSVFKDITERKLAEETLRKTESGKSELLESLNEAQHMAMIGSWEWNLHTNHVWWSDETYRIFGVMQQDFIPSFEANGKFIHPDDFARYHESFEHSLQTGEPLDEDFRLVFNDGLLKHCQAKGKIIHDDSGQPVRFVGTIMDITERKLNEEKLEKSYASLTKTLNDAINTMVKIVEMRDPYTAGHQQKVAELATAIARQMKLEDTRIDQLRMGAVIHDIGKIYIPSDILSRPGKLSAIEFSLIKTHSQSGYDIVKSMDFPCTVAKTVLQHHERLDGSGYPNGLKGEETQLEAKILAVADVIEAMSSHRPYRPALGIEKALEEVSKNRGKLFDPDVVDACMELFNSGKFVFKTV